MVDGTPRRDIDVIDKTLLGGATSRSVAGGTGATISAKKQSNEAYDGVRCKRGANGKMSRDGRNNNFGR